MGKYKWVNANELIIQVDYIRMGYTSGLIQWVNTSSGYKWVK